METEVSQDARPVSSLFDSLNISIERMIESLDRLYRIALLTGTGELLEKAVPCYGSELQDRIAIAQSRIDAIVDHLDSTVSCLRGEPGYSSQPRIAPTSTNYSRS